MVNMPINATGWTELLNGSMIKASYTMYNVALGGDGWPVILLFFMYQLMLFIKTKNFTSLFVTGVLFLTIYRVSGIYEAFAGKFIITLLVIEITIIFVMMMFNRGK